MRKHFLLVGYANKAQLYLGPAAKNLAGTWGSKCAIQRNQDSSGFDPPQDRNHQSTITMGEQRVDEAKASLTRGGELSEGPTET